MIVRGTTENRDELTGNFGSALEDTSIGDYRLIALFAEKTLNAIFGVLQHYPGAMQTSQAIRAHRVITTDDDRNHSGRNVIIPANRCVPATPSTASYSGLPDDRSRAHPLSHGQQITRDALRVIGSAAAERATEARKDAHRLAVEAWNKRMLGFQGPAQPSPALGDALNAAGYRYLEVKCPGCNTHQTVALDIVRRLKATPVHELERYMRCRQCSEVRGYPYKRSHLVALRTTKITASDPPSTWWPGER